MDLNGGCQIVDSTDQEKAACSGSRFVSSESRYLTGLRLYANEERGEEHRVSDSSRFKSISQIVEQIEQPTIPLTGEMRYLTRLWVSGNTEPREEHHVSDSSRFKSITLRTRAALKLLAFCDQHVIIQFWSARAVGEHQLITTVDQPFGLGSLDEGLLSYRKDSVRNLFLVDKNHPEEDVSPVARVFRRRLPEWTSDLTNYHPKDFPQQDCAVRCNLHGYLALPVFDSTTQLSVGVLELLMSSNNTSYAFEVQQIHKALKTQNLTSAEVFGSAAPKVPNQRRRDDLDKIFGILKGACDQHKVPFAQTWAESASTSFNSHDKMIEKTCSSFDTGCVGKVCMYSHSLPYCVRDSQMWPLRGACKERHLDKSCSFVGRALLARGSVCEDITQLCEEGFPLVHYAHMSGLRSCFAIWLHDIVGDNNYVLEFLLPFDSKDSEQVLNLVQTLKQNIVASEFELGEISPIEFAVPPRDASYLSSSIKPPLAVSSKMANTLAFETDSSGSESGSNSEFDSDSESDLGSFVKTDSADVQRQCSSKEIFPFDMSGRKRKIGSLTISAVEQHVGKPISQAAESIGVSRSTLKRYCQENGIRSWSKPNQSKMTYHATDPKLSQEVMVKATFKDDMIKFRFPTSSGLLELKNEVAQRLDLKGKLNIKYKDEENDLLLIPCDVDLHNLPEFLASNTNTSVKLLVELVSE